jgi:hypothetical protein
MSRPGPKRVAIAAANGGSSSADRRAVAEHSGGNSDDDDDIFEEDDRGTPNVQLAAALASTASASTSARGDRSSEKESAKEIEAVAIAYLKLENEVYSCQLRPFDAYAKSPIDEIIKQFDVFKYRRQVQVAMYEAAARYGILLRCKKMSASRVTMVSANDQNEFWLSACFAKKRLSMKKTNREGEQVANGNPWKITKVREEGCFSFVLHCAFEMNLF